MRVSKQLVAINQIIEKLESKGWFVEMFHESYDSFPFNFKGREDLEVSNVTTLIIYREQPSEFGMFMGQAFCSVKDQFNKATGAQIAFNHAMHNMTLALGRDGLKAVLS